MLRRAHLQRDRREPDRIASRAFLEAAGASATDAGAMGRSAVLWFGAAGVPEVDACVVAHV